MPRKTQVETLDILRNNIKAYAPDFDTSNPETKYSDSENFMDSLDEAELVMALEEDLEIEITDATIETWRGMTLAQVADSLESLQKDEFA